MLAILGVALGIWLSRGTEAVRWARVWGGPTEGPAPLSLRIELVQSDPAHPQSPPNQAMLHASDRDGRVEARHLAFDDQGSAFVTLPQLGPSARISIVTLTESLASGSIHLSRTDYFGTQRRRGGWFRAAKGEGPLRIRAGCRDGVFALGRPGRLGISVTDGAGRGARHALAVSVEGLEPVGAATPIELSSDDDGNATLTVIPRDLVASIRIAVGKALIPTATYFSSVPIEPFALRGTLIDGSIVVQSLVPVRRCYFGLINEQGRWKAGSVELACDPSDRCSGRVPLDAAVPIPAWLIVGTEPSLDGPNVIGWPVSIPPGTFVTEAVTVRDRLLLDGKSAAFARFERDRARRVGVIAVGSTMAMLVLGASLLRSWRRSRADFRHLSDRMPEGSRSLVQAPARSLVVLALLLLLALAALAVWAQQRLWQ